MYCCIHQIKIDCYVGYTIWDGKLIHTVSSIDVDYMLCETIPDKKKKKAKQLELIES